MKSRKHRNSKSPSPREKILAGLAAGILKVLLATVRVRIEDRSGLMKNSPDFPLIYTFWHNRILAITAAFKRSYPAGRQGVSVLTSPSRDGEILARVMASFGMGAIRGSSSKRGPRALRECIAHLQTGADLAVTPDGPRGPKYQLGPGLILLSQQTEARILPIQAKFSSAWVMKSWDSFRIPKPFSRVDILLHPYEKIPLTPTHGDFEAERMRIQNLLNHAID